MNKTTDYISPSEAGTLAGLFRTRVQRTPERVAYRYHDGSKWCARSWAAVAAEVGRWQAALKAEGLRKGDRVALQMRNGLEWVLFEQAALGLGLVVVPLYVEDRADNIAYVLQDAGARVLAVQNWGRLRRLADALPRDGCLHRIVVVHGEQEGTLAEPRAVALRDWLPREKQPLLTARASPDDLATLVYTSGTTGRAKGVMLSHRAILENAYAGLQVEPFYPEDLFLSFLPLSHMLERTAGYYLPMMAGATVAHARSVQQLAEDMAAVRPTVLISVPRVFERIHERVEHGLESRSPLARLLFRATVAVGWRRFESRQGRRFSVLAVALRPLLNRLVAGRIRAALGGRLRFAISGGAALPPKVARCFIGLGVELLQGYGLTETGPVVSVNVPNDNRPEGVGLPLPGVEVRIGEEDELLVRSPAVMLGYWNNREATEARFAPDGWLRTGDQARLCDGHIRLIGRLKDILVLSNGEKVSPSDMETAIGTDPLVEQVLVVGEGKAFLAALVALQPERWPAFAAGLGLDPAAPESLRSEAVQQALMERISSRLHGFPGYAKIRRVGVTLDPWTIENGLLTPTLKLKRAEVTKRYGEHIAALFAVP